MSSWLKNKVLLLLSISLILILSGCSNSSNTAASGSSIKGPTSGAIITIFSLNTNGSRGAQIDVGVITTDANGNWNVTMPSGSSGKYIVVSTGGTYTDEATGNIVSAGVMRGILDLSTGTTAPITPFTDAMLQIAQNNAASAGGIDNALANVIANATDVFGFNPFNILPAVQPNFTGSDAQRFYALLLGGISEQSKPHADVNNTFSDSMAIALAFINDLNSTTIQQLNNAIDAFQVSLQTSSQLKNILQRLRDPSIRHTLNAVVSGLTGTLVLQNNGKDNLTFTSNNTQSFSQELNDSATYNVTVLTQPTGQTCTISNGTGTSTNDINVTVSCATNTIVTHRLRANISGLDNTLFPITSIKSQQFDVSVIQNLILQNNGGDDLLVQSNGLFSFSQEINDSSTYSVTILTQPQDHTCTVVNGTGTATNDIDVNVTCIQNPSTDANISVEVTGLSGTLVLQNNGTDNLTFTTNTTKNFSQKIPQGQDFNVTVLTQPANQTCIVDGEGIVSSPTVFTQVNCTTNVPTQSTISVNVSGINTSILPSIKSPNFLISSSGGSLILQNNGTNNLSISNNGIHAFTQTINTGSSYNITIFQTLTGHTCSISNGSGTATTSNVTVNVSCTTSSTTTSGADQFCPPSSMSPIPKINGWQWSHAKPVGAKLLSIAEGNGVFVAVGQSGVIVRSTDKINWQEVQSNYPSNITKIIFDGSAFVATTKQENATFSDINGSLIVNTIPNKVLISCDGETWAVKTINFNPDSSANAVRFDPNSSNGSNNFLSATFANGVYYAVANLFVFTSINAVDWNVSAPFVPSLNLKQLATDGSTVVAIGNTGVMTSTDNGVTWQKPITAPSSALRITHDGSEFIAYINNSDISKSNDGLTWTNTTTGGFLVPDRGIIVFNTQTIMFGGSDIFTSTNHNNNAGFSFLNISNTWQEGDFRDTNLSTTPPVGIGQALNNINDAIVTSANTLLVVGDGGLIAEQTASAIPALGSNSWIRRSIGGGTGMLNDIATNNGSSFVVAGDSTLLFSTDGLTWSKSALPTYTVGVLPPFTLDTFITNVEHDGTNYVAFGENSAILTSSDGQNWTLENNPDSPASASQGPSHAFNNKIIFFYRDTFSGSNNAKIRESNGSITPVDVTNGDPVGTSTNISEFADNGSRVVAIGQFGVTTSTDLINWSIVDLTALPISGITNCVNMKFDSIAYNGTSFVVIGFDDTNTFFAIKSTDGLNWSVITPVVTSMPSISVNPFFTFANNVGLSGNSALFRPRLRASNGKFVLLTDVSGAPVESADGINWDYLFQRGLNPQPTDYWFDYIGDNTGNDAIIIGSRNAILSRQATIIR